MKFSIEFDSMRLLTLVLLIESLVISVNSTIITSVGFIFEAFSPYAMLQFFEFSDKGWNITENCLRDMYTYLGGLRRGSVWAVKLYDATSYYGGGAFGGEKIRIHSPKICRDLLSEYRSQKEESILVDAKSVNSTVVPFPVQVVVGHYIFQFSGRHKNKFQKIQQLICFPQSCSDRDLEQILEVQLFQSNGIIQNNSYLSHRIVYGNYSPINDANFYILIALFSTSLFLYTGAFLLQFYFEFQSSRKPLQLDVETSPERELKRRSPLTANIESLFAKKFQIKIIDMNWSMRMATDNVPKIVTKIRRYRFEDFLNQISIQNVMYDLFRSEEDPPQMRLQFIFTFLIIYAHLVAENSFVANNRDFSEKTFLESHFLLRHSSYLFDGLFVLNGSKLSFRYLQESPKENLNVLRNLKFVLKLVSSKILRHAPSYIICLFAAQMLDRYLYTNVALEIPSLDYKNCGFNNLLSTVFYWDIFFPLTERCLPWAWFMSLEVQFFMVACLVLLLTQVEPKYSSVIGIGFFFMANVGATFWDSTESKGPVEVNSTLFINVELTQFNLISDNVFLSVTPYLTGLYLGYVLHKTASSVKLNLFILITGYTGCLFIWVFFHFGFQMVFLTLSSFISAVALVLSHIIWTLVIMWIILTSFSEYFEFVSQWLEYTTAIETLSPISLLVAPILIRFFVFTADAPIYTSNARIFPQAIGLILITYAISFIIYIIFDGLFYTIYKSLTQE